jgi:DNA-binding MarR family transcriptional regulator
VSTPTDFDQIVRLIPRIYRSLGCPIVEAAGQQQISMTQYGAMAFLWRNPGTTLSEVARELNVSLGSTSDMVDRLVEMGLVQRQTNPDNRRQVQLSLTDSAGARIREMKQERRRQFEQVRAKLNDEEWAGFIQGMATWADVLEQDMPRRHDPILSSGESRRD